MRHETIQVSSWPEVSIRDAGGADGFKLRSFKMRRANIQDAIQDASGDVRFNEARHYVAYKSRCERGRQIQDEVCKYSGCNS